MTIAGAIDAINDKLAGSDQPAATTIEGALKLLLDNVGSGGGGGGGALIIQTELDEEAGSYVPVGVTYNDVAANVSEKPVIIIMGGAYLYFGGFQLDANNEPTNCLVFHGFQDQWNESTHNETCQIAYTVWDPSYPDLFLSTVTLPS